MSGLSVAALGGELEDPLGERPQASDTPPAHRLTVRCGRSDESAACPGVSACRSGLGGVDAELAQRLGAVLRAFGGAASYPLCCKRLRLIVGAAGLERLALPWRRSRVRIPSSASTNPRISGGFFCVLGRTANYDGSRGYHSWAPKNLASRFIEDAFGPVEGLGLRPARRLRLKHHQSARGAPPATRRR